MVLLPLAQQGTASPPDNTKSVSYSLTHRNDARNKVYSTSGSMASLRSEDGGGDQGVDMHVHDGDPPNKKAPRFLGNPEKNWGPKRKAGRLNDGEAEEAGAEGNPHRKNSERHQRNQRDENGVKGRGAEYYKELNKEKAEAVRAMRAAARAAAAAAAEEAGASADSASKKPRIG